MGVEGAGRGTSRGYHLRVQRNGNNPFYVNDTWDYPITQSNRHLLLHPNQVMIENPFYARMMAEVQAEEAYFRTLSANRSAYPPASFSGVQASVAEGVIHENMLSLNQGSSPFGAVGQEVANANRPRAVDLEAASVSTEGDEENEDMESTLELMEDDHEVLLAAIVSAKKEMIAKKTDELKSLRKKMNEPKAEKKVDPAEDIEEIPSTFRWVHIEIV